MQDGNLYRLPRDDLFGDLPHHRVVALNQHQPRRIRHAFVTRTQNRQKIGVALAGVPGAVHCLHHAGHAGVNVGLKAVFCASSPVAVCLPWCLKIGNPVAFPASDEASCITVEIVVG